MRAAPSPTTLYGPGLPVRVVFTPTKPRDDPRGYVMQQSQLDSIGHAANKAAGGLPTHPAAVPPAAWLGGGLRAKRMRGTVRCAPRGGASLLKPGTFLFGLNRCREWRRSNLPIYRRRSDARAAPRTASMLQGSTDQLI